MKAITDVCVVTQDLERAIRFYTGPLGLTLDHRMEGFADFHGLGIALAVWAADHLRATTGVAASAGGHGSAVMIAVRLDTPADVDARYHELSRAGVRFQAPPKDYPWNARCAYFTGPDDELWELYAWYDGGEPGAVRDRGGAHRLPG
ncbi:VOC family protein [Nonomuraea sp. H19]|uniref:VOC family protein n=1 Tax=Nonomuraea sp. H19 TaxID=3452206 RepID=UPI003F886F5A